MFTHAFLTFTLVVSLVFASDHSNKMDPRQDGHPSSGVSPTHKPSRVMKLPQILKFGGPISPISVQDFDGDGITDIATLVMKSNKKYALVIAWGKGSEKWDIEEIKDFPLETEEAESKPAPLEMRGVPTNSIASFELKKNGNFDIITSCGVAFNKGKAKFEWKSFEEDCVPFSPVVPVKSGNEVLIYRANLRKEKSANGSVSAIGVVQRCSLDMKCQDLPLPKDILPDGMGSLQVVDFDGDGKVDVIGGWHTFEANEIGALYWGSKNKDPFPVAMKGVINGDFKLADLDGDGLPELIGQRSTNNPEFPAFTRVMKLKDGKFEIWQNLRNAYNHMDNAYIGNIYGDGKLSLVQIGVDSANIYITNQQGKYIGPHDPAAVFDIRGGAEFPSIKGIGVQAADIMGNGKPVLAVRNLEGNLTLMAVPK